MKRTPSNEENTPAPGGPRYWRSIDQLADTPEFKEWLHREFPAGASEVDGVNRRRFLQLMAGSFALAGAGMAGCRRPEAHIRPYSKAPERVVPGVEVFYASSMPLGRENIPLIVETHQNRPIKVEGNPGYKPYGGSTNLVAQSSVLDLYDPDRATRHYRGTRALSQAEVQDLLSGVSQRFAQSGGQGLAILAEPSSSPTRARLVRQLREQLPNLVWAEYEAVDYGNAERATAEIFGRALRPVYAFDRARCILSLDGDFVHREPGHLGQARAFTATRKVHSPKDVDQMSRLYMAESVYTLTGTMADHRLRVPTSQIPAFAALVLAEVLEQTGGDAQFAGVLRGHGAGLEVDARWITECVRDLLRNRGQALVYAGTHLPVETQATAYYINELLGAVGQTLSFVELPEEQPAASIAQLAEAVNGGQVDTLVILGGNPTYNAPADLEWATLQQRVPNVIRHGYYVDETSVATIEQRGVHITCPHYLESWGDGRAHDGTYLPVQPMILPLFDSVSENELIARLGGATQADPYALVLETFGTLATGGDVQKAFNRFLFEGLLEGSAYPTAQVAVPVDTIRTSLSEAQAAQAPSATALELRILPDNRLLDGRFTNNGWLQECPDPITKLTWDNAIWISPALAREIGYEPAQRRLLSIAAKKTGAFNRGAEIAPVGEIEINGRKIRGPIQIQPGLADYTVAVSLGYGRTKAGRVGNGTGFSAYPAVTTQSQSLAVGAKLSLVDGEDYRLANTQEHWSLEGRAIIREGNASYFVEHPEFASHMGMEAHSPAVYGAKQDKSLQYKVLNQPRGNSAFETPDFTAPPPNVDVWNTPEGLERFKGPQQWGMAIDLNTCIGCQACVVACQAENNIPIVGKDQVIRGREMHWMRIDRYYSSGTYEENKNEIPNEPQVSFQPMLCVHCERAPCEQVCPVNATVHDHQGLNVMAYNRCVGTRYCSNNCPYKVRRFNFFDWNKREIGEYYKGPLGPNEYENDGIRSELKAMQKNPDVTVRMRGVMEKCTYCVQRIERAKINQKVKTAKDPATAPDEIWVPDGIVKTACQQVCPTDAIEFGDVSDPETLVSQLKTSPRDYAVLGYLNTRPRTTYLARLRNPNPAMPDYGMPHSNTEYDQRNSTNHGADSHNGEHAHPEPANGTHNPH